MGPLRVIAGIPGTPYLINGDALHSILLSFPSPGRFVRVIPSDMLHHITRAEFGTEAKRIKYTVPGIPSYGRFAL